MESIDKFKFEPVLRGDQKIIMLKGAVDEDTNFEPIKALGKDLVLNFKEVTSINSLGIRGWVNFMKDMSGANMAYEECPPVIVRQFNMVPSFLAHAKVLSVYVPYVCDSSGEEKLVLYQSNQFGQVPETIPCEECEEGEMEIDSHPKQYFAFFK